MQSRCHLKSGETLPWQGARQHWVCGHPCLGLLTAFLPYYQCGKGDACMGGKVTGQVVS
jgi:hypothetical protein